MNFKEYLNEQSDEYVLQALAAQDINASIKDNVVYVDSTEVKNAAKILKKINCNKKVKELK